MRLNGMHESVFSSHLSRKDLYPLVPNEKPVTVVIRRMQVVEVHIIVDEEFKRVDYVTVTSHILISFGQVQGRTFQ